MLIDFFYTLRAAKLPVSVKEFLTLLEALKLGVVGPNAQQTDDSTPSGYKLEDFYFLARTTLVKDEKHYDKFDRAFSAYFHGVELVTDFTQEVPLDWLKKTLELDLTPEQKAAIEKMGWDELMETLKKRLEEQKERHEGGSKWIGTGGTSPFGHGGYNPQGIRIGGAGKNKSAVKVWEQRAYRDYDDTQELGTRNIKVALRRLRKFAREGQQRQGAALDGRGRHHGRAHCPGGRAVFSGQNRVQTSGVLLLSQLRVRLHVEEQPAPLCREVRDLGHHPQVQQGLQADLCR